MNLCRRASDRFVKPTPRISFASLHPRFNRHPAARLWQCVKPINFYLWTREVKKGVRQRGSRAGLTPKHDS